MKSLWIILLCLVFTQIFGQTIIKNGQHVAGKWTRKNCPYIIEGEAIVPKDEKLIIQAGTIVRFKTGENRDYNKEGYNLGFLRVLGQIEALGTQEKRIIFTRDQDEGFWGNIFIQSDSTLNNVFEFCLFEYAFYSRFLVTDSSYDGNATGALSFYGAHGYAQNCLFANNGWNGLNAKKKSKVKVQDCTFSKNKYAIEINSNAQIEVMNSILWDNKKDFWQTTSGKVKFSDCLLQDKLPEDFISDSNNIFEMDPYFKDPDNKNFKLSTNSPAKRKTTTKKNVGAFTKD